MIKLSAKYDFLKPGVVDHGKSGSCLSVGNDKTLLKRGQVLLPDERGFVYIY
jgi:hypothetical protein